MTTEQHNFIMKIYEGCKNNSSYNILPSLTIAQAIRESNWGKSKLSTLAYNFFGIKWTKNCNCDYVEMPTKEWNGVAYIDVLARFRKYKDFSDGIKGYYDFLTNNKRYSNLIGEKNSYTACVKIQQDGYATAPNYGVTLYNNYVVPYNLLSFDAGYDEEYVVGRVYTLMYNMFLRDAPKGTYKNYTDYSDITVDAQIHSHVTDTGNIVLNKDTRVTCKGVETIDDEVWLQIPSGWICGKSKTKRYVI